MKYLTLRWTPIFKDAVEVTERNMQQPHNLALKVLLDQIKFH